MSSAEVAARHPGSYNAVMTCRTNALVAAVLVVALAPGVAQAQAQQPAERAAEPAASASGLRSEPAVKHIVIEDDGVRIEELRVRGQTQRVVVRPKAEGAAAYEIIVPSNARDTSTGPGANRGAGGARVWSVLAF